MISVFAFLQELKAVLLGSSLNYFSVEWRNQGFAFSDDLRYGIVQRKVILFMLSSDVEIKQCSHAGKG